MMRYKYFLLLILPVILLFQSCSSDIVRDDAVRIKEKHREKYEKVPGTEKIRNASTLRGNVDRIEKVRYMCDDSVTGEDVFVVFLDRIEGAKIEYIPIDYVDLVGVKEKVKLDTNWFEKYNDPLNPREMREVPVVTREMDTCNIICDCGPVDLSICENVECRVNTIINNWYFIDLNIGNAFYNDRLPFLLGVEHQEDYFAEVSLGVRLGKRHNWGLGVSFFSGVPIYNSLDDNIPIVDGILEQASRKPAIMLFGKYYFLGRDEEFTQNCETCESEYSFIPRRIPVCLIPYVYGQLGVSIDNMTMDFWSLNYGCNDCKRELEVNDGFKIDGDIGLSFGIGAGFEYPLSCNYSLSFDVGFKSLAIGEKSNIPINGILVPEIRRISMFIIRLGVTI